MVAAACAGATAQRWLAYSLASALGVTACIVALAALLAWLAADALPAHVASDYIGKALKDDMCSPFEHYFSRRGCAFWVAVDDASGEVVGTIAVEAPADVAAPDQMGWRWREGDAELRRMSVAQWTRGEGVSRALFAELRRFVAQTHGYKRIVLSTSSLQAVAHDHLYPGLGFEAQGRRRVFGKVHIGYFAMDLHAETA